ncbi:hypothetical protein HF888_11005 [Bermanella marisrubri]|uniref:Uncharacterized protein n=1 Tax=Bermanella marisrubri TaxID=207949 RepID=Q1N5H9_9GAMM|nr:hypothetical protein [Bermanella marisrubri]EAT13963.1 hypothetical protein RED65_11234 [Oceanobacter sp. RED65] [Bermanella marisrubri]QIZ84713.1 hypothetical protein HF888_11005 [Bermanella marisrubri]
MDRLYRREVEQILGIYPPFQIKELHIDPEKELLEVEIEEQLKQTRRIFQANRPKTKRVQWHHTKLGRFSTVITLYATPHTFSKHRTINPPAFIGPEDSQYTYHLQQMVVLAANNNLKTDGIQKLLEVDRSIINQILADSENQEQEQQANTTLPLETDPIWKSIIRHEIPFKTQLAPLRFLLSKLELNCMNAKDDPSVMQNAVATLRQFFIKNARQLKSEYAQIGVLNTTPSEKQTESSEQSEGTKKRVTLTVDHPIWHSILQGEVDLLSKNMGLNLFITQLKTLYKKANDGQEQMQVARELLSYLKKNKNNLRNELMSISRMVKQMNEQPEKVDLPAPGHQLWSDILAGRTYIESDKMALKLLLVKARALEDQHEASALICDYFNRNKRSMDNELRQLEQHITAAV